MRHETTSGADRTGGGANSQERRLNRLREPLPSRVQGLSPLPEAYDAALDAGLRDLGITLPDSIREAIADHVRLLLAWSAAVNLTAIRDPVAAARRHVVDSLTAVPLLRTDGIDRFVDLGSGGGFPGLPLALALPARRALLVDSIAKKVAFLDTAIAAVGARGRVRTAATRAEALGSDPAHRERWRAVTARAVASLAELVELSFPLLEPGGRLVAWKRDGLADEIAAAERAVDALGGGSIEIVDPAVGDLPDHRLVVIEKHGRTGRRFPRDPAERRRLPW